MLIGTAVGLRDDDPPTASQGAAVSTASTAVSMILAMVMVTVAVTVMSFTLSYIASMVIAETTFMSMAIGEVRLVLNGDEVEAERAVRRVGQHEDNDDDRRRRRSLWSCRRRSSSEVQR